MRLSYSSEGWDLYRRNKYIEWDSGWRCLKYGIDHLTEVLPERPFNADVHTMLYSFVYKMCIHEKPHQYAEELYQKFRETFVNYINKKVLPPLKGMPNGESMLKELEQRWSNHKVMTRRLSGIFLHLDLYIVRARMKAVDLNGVGLKCFHEQVYVELNGKVRDAVISLIDQERKGEQIDRALLKNVLDIFVEIGMGQMGYYENDFEADMLKDTAAYYSEKATSWIREDSCPDYMLKAEECLNREKERVSHYLHSSSEPKLLEKVQHELLSVYAPQLLEKEHSGCRALLRDDKVQDLSRMYRLFSKIPCGLEPVAAIFKQHVTAEGTALVKQAEDAASNKKAEKRDIVGMQEQVFVRKVIELHDKYMAYVNGCFMNHTLFHKALKEAFEVFCNKGVAGSSSAELLATFCDNILKKGDSEKVQQISRMDATVKDKKEQFKTYTRRTKHVTAVGTPLVKQAEDAASNKKAEKRDIVGMQEQVWLQDVKRDFLLNKC